MGLLEEMIAKNAEAARLRGDAPVILDPRRDDRPTWVKIGGALFWVYVAYQIIAFLI
jgi:hypothetical protein